MENFVPVNYYVKHTEGNSSYKIIRIEKESKNHPKKAIGTIIYFSGSSTEENTLWSESKSNMANSRFEFSKKGFPVARKP